MLIKSCKGYELEKELPNTSEDFFNRSEVTYLADGKEKTLHILYVRFFEERLTEMTPYSSEPVFMAGNRPIYFKDLVGLVSLIKNPEFRQRKRIYINSEKEFVSLFKDIDYSNFPGMFEEIEKSGYELRSPMEYIIQNSR